MTPLEQLELYIRETARSAHALHGLAVTWSRRNSSLQGPVHLANEMDAVAAELAAVVRHLTQIANMLDDFNLAQSRES